MPSKYREYRRRKMSGSAVEIQKITPSENVVKCRRIVKFSAVEPWSNRGAFRRRNTSDKAVGKRRFSPSKNSKKARPKKSVAPLSRRRFGGF